MIAIINYNAGNTQSVANALQSLGVEFCITDKASKIKEASKVILPGVGHAQTAMQYLQEKKLDKLISTLTQPVLGICLGLQLMCRFSEEGNTQGLGIFNAEVKKFPATEIIPHMGWNNCENISSSCLFKNISEKIDFYFVHSYYASISINTIATGNYILPFSAAMQQNNFFATQFHPEKSGSNGVKLLQNFLTIC
jgi:glutamine amidotransferase